MSNNKRRGTTIQRLFSARLEDPMANNLICFVITLGYTWLFCDSVLRRPPELEALEIQTYIDAFFPTIATFVACIIFQNISIKKENTKFSLTAWTIVAIILLSGYMLNHGVATRFFHVVIICLLALIIIILAFSAILQATSDSFSEPSNIISAPESKTNNRNTRKG